MQEWFAKKGFEFSYNDYRKWGQRLIGMTFNRQERHQEGKKLNVYQFNIWLWIHGFHIEYVGKWK